MATITNTVLDTSGFIPQTWALKALEVLRRRIVLAKIITTDKDMGEAGWVGKTLNIPYPGTFTAQDKVAGTAVTAQAPSGGATVSLTLNKHKVVDFLLEDYGAAQANGDALERFISPAVIALAEQFETDLWSMYPSFTGTAVGTIGTDLTAATIRSARQNLNDAKAPMEDRHLVISDKDEISLLGDSSLATYYAFSRAGSIEQGMLPPLYGFQPHVSQITPVVAGSSNAEQLLTITGTPTGGTFTLTFSGQTTSAIAYNATAATVQAALVALSNVGAGNVVCSGGPLPGTGSSTVVVWFTGSLSNNTTLMTSTDSLTGGSSPASHIAAGSDSSTKCIAFHKSAMMMAMRPFRDIPAGSGVSTATVVDEDSGIAIRVLKQYKAEYRAEYVGFDILYGYVALRPGLGLVARS